MEINEKIISDPNIMHGEPCIKGTRIPVYIVLDCLADGMSAEEILKEYPRLTKEDLTAAISYASRLARHEEHIYETSR